MELLKKSIWSSVNMSRDWSRNERLWGDVSRMRGSRARGGPLDRLEWHEYKFGGERGTQNQWLSLLSTFSVSVCLLSETDTAK